MSDNFAAKRLLLAAHQKAFEDSTYTEKARNSGLAGEIQNRAVSYRWSKASILTDHPDKVLASADNNNIHLSPKLREAVDATKHELFLVSPYFVPGKKGVELLITVRRRGVRVVVATNSLASTDEIPVHAGYQRYRKSLLQAGIEIYEMKPTAGARREKHSNGLRGSSSASLHAKMFTFDRRLGFIGSYHLDPRSNKLNTEMGVFFDCPSLAKQLPETIERAMDRDAYRLEFTNGRIAWIALQGGRQIRFSSEPEAGLWKRAKVHILSWLPIESIL